MWSIGFRWLTCFYVKTVSPRKINSSVANGLFESLPKPPKSKTFKLFEKSSTRYAKFVSHPNIVHNMTWNLHHLSKNKLSEWTYWKLIYLGDNKKFWTKMSKSWNLDTLFSPYLNFRFVSKYEISNAGEDPLTN